jgi:hypothetical protein
MELITAAYCWQIINSQAWITLLAVKHNVVKRSASYLLPSTSNVIRHPNSSAKFLCASRQAAHRSPCGAEPWIGQQNYKTPCIKIRFLSYWYLLLCHPFGTLYLMQWLGTSSWIICCSKSKQPHVIRQGDLGDNRHRKSSVVQCRTKMGR